MLKFVETEITFSEVPNEISLCINISNCPCECKGCHSPHLAKNIGKNFNVENLNKLIKSSKGISCICLMGGDIEPLEVDNIAYYIKDIYPHLKTAWYSGRQKISKDINPKHFDFIKVGPYMEDKGPLSKKGTNQVMYEVKLVKNKPVLKDITFKFQK